MASILTSVPPEVWTALSHLIAALIGWVIPAPRRRSKPPEGR